MAVEVQLDVYGTVNGRCQRRRSRRVRNLRRGYSDPAAVLVEGLHKTCIRRIAKSFNCLGYRFSPEGLRAATKRLTNFIARLRQLYEHEPGEGVSARLGAYVQRWLATGVPAPPAVAE
jgi:hypothetical protein